MKKIENKNSYVYVLYDEPYTKEGLIDLMKETHNACLGFGCRLILVNLLNMPGIISTMDRFEMGIQGALLFKSNFKIAVVYRKEEINQFAETVGVNRGMNTYVVSDMESALKWLGIVE